MPEPGTGDLTDLRRYVQCFDGVFDASFCATMVASFEQMPQFQLPNGRGYRAAMEQSGWTELNVTPHASESLKGAFYEQVERYLSEYNARVPLCLPVPVRSQLENLRIKRYQCTSAEQFQPHFDALDKQCNRYMVFLWYLNDVFVGGETEFCNLGLRVQARAGRLLMFPPYWMFQHAGLPPRSNDKYIVSTYLLF